MESEAGSSSSSSSSSNSVGTSSLRLSFKSVSRKNHFQAQKKATFTLMNVPLLSDLCVQVIIDQFETHPITLKDLIPKYRTKIVKALPISLPLELSSVEIEDELFWQRSAEHRWENNQVKEHGTSWKRLYFEKYVQGLLEEFDPMDILPSLNELDAREKEEEEAMNEEELMKALEISRDHVLNLKLEQLVSHLDVGKMLDALPNVYCTKPGKGNKKNPEYGI
eukprot:TRINITY_DN1659_c0_g1_i17.p1 TRINITY_DN1659_c0_g1~~TRINITY_DN1659_c0_g1_i17.p1  ORF type:complete len:222 (+),score=78.20 TRINITY_DN1659_c0_g1_i17:97-762(+)